MSSNQPEYPGSSIYYYSTLADAGVNSLYPPIRGFFEELFTETEPTPDYITTEFEINITVLEANFTHDVSLILSAQNVELYDCGYFTDRVVITNDYMYDFEYPFYNTISDNCSTVISPLTGTDSYKTQAERQSLAGKMFVKNQSYSNSYPLSTALDVIFNKYSSPVKSELYESIKDFDIIYDTIVVETENYLVFDKIAYENEIFIDPITKNTVFARNGNLNRFSNRFFNEKDKTVTFVILDQPTSLSASNYKSIYPNIYQYNVNNNVTTKIFPKIDTDIEELFNLSTIFNNTFSVNIVNIQNPILTYNSFNEIYKLTFIGEDNNGLFHLFDYGFYLYDTQVSFIESKYYQHNKDIKTTNFENTDTVYSYVNIISGAYTTNSNGALVL